MKEAPTDAARAMALPCRECKEPISWYVTRCPFCDAENPLGYGPGTKWFWVGVGLILLGGFVVWFSMVLGGLARIDSLPK
jgi:hypothetical protein